MLSYPLQDFITIRASNTLSPQVVTQPESGWLDLSGFADVFAYLEVPEFTLGGATTLTMAYQTSPTKDEVFFQNITTVATIANGVTVTQMKKSSVTNPLSRFIRWQLGVTGTATSAFDITFRIWLACNAEGKLRSAVGMSPDTRSRIVGPPPGMSGGATPRIPPPSMIGPSVQMQPGTSSAFVPGSLNPAYSRTR